MRTRQCGIRTGGLRQALRQVQRQVQRQVLRQTLREMLRQALRQALTQVPQQSLRLRCRAGVASDALWRFQLCSGQIRAVPRIERVPRSFGSGGRAAVVGTP
ncbi:hypothetical protein PEP31012_01915 [Pandoraea eparura]|uniref:Uncharacterized protein n=1 Tax=Pandoraea eparura TaxID=2508291 RepID=A0A5E4UAS6_9BURK|nr:hypothetical protein PEP31012_01915 [Pandoraea eparura]